MARGHRWMVAVAVWGLLGQSAIAQAGKGKLTGALLDCSSERWEAALEKLAVALPPAANVKPIQHIRARLCHIRANLEVASDTLVKGKYPDALHHARGSVDQIRAIDDEKAQRRTREERTELEERLTVIVYNAGAAAYNAKSMEMAARHFDDAYAVGADPFAMMMLGFARQQLDDKAGAIEALQQARATIEGREDAEPDSREGSLYQNLAVLLLEDRPEDALGVVQAGQERLADHEQLDAMELAIYERVPELFDQARGRFEAALAASPKDLGLRLAWGSMLLANGNADEAKGVFEEVFAADPLNLKANLNLGALHINRAAELQKQNEARRRPDSGIRRQMLDEMRAAYPYLVTCHEQDPSNEAWLDQLVTIASVVPELKSKKASWAKLRDAL